MPGHYIHYSVVVKHSPCSPLINKNCTFILQLGRMSRVLTSQLSEDETTNCPICFEPYSTTEQLPRILPCHHSLCEECIETILNRKPKGKLECPECRWVPRPVQQINTLYSFYLWPVIPSLFPLYLKCSLYTHLSAYILLCHVFRNYTQ